MFELQEINTYNLFNLNERKSKNCSFFEVDYASKVERPKLHFIKKYFKQKLNIFKLNERNRKNICTKNHSTNTKYLTKEIHFVKLG